MDGATKERVARVEGLGRDRMVVLLLLPARIVGYVHNLILSYRDLIVWQTAMQGSARGPRNYPGNSSTRSIRDRRPGHARGLVDPVQHCRGSFADGQARLQAIPVVLPGLARRVRYAALGPRR